MANEGMSSEDDSPLIYGVEYQCRALASHTSQYASDQSTVRFMVGTQSLKNDNQVHLLEYSEESNSLAKIIFKHLGGEIWHINGSPKYPNLLTTCYSTRINKYETKIENHCSLWKFPVDLSNCLVDEDLVSSAPLEKLFDFDGEGDIGRTALWHPEEGHQIISIADQKLLLWDIESKKLAATYTIDPSSDGLKGISKFNKLNTIRWSPHSNCGLIGMALGNNIYIKDIRTKPVSFVYNFAAHNQMVRDIDFNPNAQYLLASCGDDCQSRFWDLRQTAAPLVTMDNHSHWIWSIKYNPFHDQLILTSSSDSRVILIRITSLASQPFGHLIDDIEDADEFEIEDEKNINGKKPASDGIVATFDEHEDSVYSVQWSNSDPWIFASLSYDGRVVINKVPKTEKFRILF